MTYQFTLSFPWRDKAAGTQGCETFEISAQHPRGYYGVFYGETALTISRHSQSDEVLTQERPQQPSSCPFANDAMGQHSPLVRLWKLRIAASTARTRRAGNARQGVSGPGRFRAYPVSTDTHYILG